jgi:hypothetical protein
MSGSQEVRIEPTPPVVGAGAVQPVRSAGPAAPPAEPSRNADRLMPAAATGGSLRPAYSQFVVNPDTNEVVLRIKDSLTDAVLNEFPSKEVQAMSKHLQDYAQAMARRRVTIQNGSAS